jgi:hypothetical protein
MNAKDPRFTWKGEIAFDGTAQEFNAMMNALREAPVSIDIPEWADRPRHLAGCMPVPLDHILRKEFLKSLVEKSPTVKIKFIQDIPGGMRTPHFHLGEDVLLLDRERFKQFVGEVASTLAEHRVDAGGDYIEVMDPIGPIGAIPINLP